MAEEINVLNILDSAVKIGLGACITAISGYLVLRQNQKGQIASEYRAEKRKHIGDLLEAIGYVSDRALDYWSYINDREINTSRGIKMPEDIEKQLYESQRKFHASFKKITLSEGKYFVVADEEKYDELIQYAEFLAQFHSNSVRGTCVNLKEWPSQEKELRKKLLKSIREVYELDKNA